MEASGALSQQALLQFLQDPASYPHRPAHVQLLQTHASFVAIAPPLVYKVKKPVNLGFLDFSTLALRKHFCETEVRLNRRLCARIYEGTVPVVRRGHQLVWRQDDQEEGEQVVEYAVQMKQLEDGYFLHQLLEREAVSPADLDLVVDRLKHFYQAQTSTPEITRYGRIEQLKINTDENFAQTEPYLGATLPRPTYEAVRFYADRFYEKGAALLHRRCREGRILDCHGDLHAEHIHLAPEGVCIYDCIEFNDRFRYIDVASDVAFLAMDLDRHDRPDLSRYVTTRIAEALNDPDLPALMDFYKCYRAYVRGKVESMRAEEPEVPDEERRQSRMQAGHYFQLALRFAVAGSQPLVLVLMGRVGTGKSTQAQALGRLLGWEVVSSDRTRKQTAGVSLYERGDAAARERLYSSTMTEQTYEALRRQARENARQERSTILDATFGNPKHRSALLKTLQQQQIPCCFVEVVASEETVRDRLQRRAHAARELSDARLEDFELLSRRYQPPSPEEDLCHLAVQAESAPAETTREILKGLICLGLGRGL